MTLAPEKCSTDELAQILTREIRKWMPASVNEPLSAAVDEWKRRASLKQAT